MSHYQYEGTVVPDNWEGSTTLNSSIKSYTDLTTRVKMQLGFPILAVEICDKMIYDNINIAIEWFSKYAGYTEEYFIFDSLNYVNGVGIQMDDVIAGLGTAYHTQFEQIEIGIDPSLPVQPDDQLPDYNPADPNAPSIKNNFWEYDKADYRKVISCFSFDPFSTGGTDLLFNIDYIYGSQAYYSAFLGGTGYDLVTWHNLKEWTELRAKMFATQPKFMFDNRRQTLRILPQPKTTERYYGIVGCYLEKSIRDMIAERWIFQYSLALTKVSIGQIRGKFGAVNLVGGGTINWNDLLSQGLKSQDDLEVEIKGAGEALPLGFFVG
jgi:hypothetical protein